MSHELLQQGIEQLNLTVSTTPLMEYLSLMERWNKAYNLTAIKTLEDKIKLHLLDSLAVIPWIQGPHVIDVGTGAGLPGIPLAIAKPEVQFVLLDSNGKKTRFLTEVKRILELKNVEIIQSRVEQYQPPFLFNTIVSRAFSDIQQMLHWTRHLIHPQGIWLAMKGRQPMSEISAIKESSCIHTYSVPYVDSERCCVVITSS